MCDCDSIRSVDDEDAFPDELKVPIGRADHMLDDAAIVPAVDVSDDPKTQEEDSPQQESPAKSPDPVSIFQGMLLESLIFIVCRDRTLLKMETLCKHLLLLRHQGVC